MFNISHISLFIFYSCVIVQQKCWECDWKIMNYPLNQKKVQPVGCIAGSRMDAPPPRCRTKDQTKRACRRERGAPLTVGGAVTEKQFQAQSLWRIWSFGYLFDTIIERTTLVDSVSRYHLGSNHQLTCEREKKYHGMAKAWCLKIDRLATSFQKDKIRLETRPSNTVRHNFGILLTSKVSGGSFSPPYVPLICAIFFW